MAEDKNTMMARMMKEDFMLRVCGLERDARTMKDWRSSSEEV